jgi:hypothetical protein
VPCFRFSLHVMPLIIISSVSSKFPPSFPFIFKRYQSKGSENHVPSREPLLFL